MYIPVLAQLRSSTNCRILAYPQILNPSTFFHYTIVLKTCSVSFMVTYYMKICTNKNFLLYG